MYCEKCCVRDDCEILLKKLKEAGEELKDPACPLVEAMRVGMGWAIYLERTRPQPKRT